MRMLLNDFASMCEKSRTTDGDRQGDGWGAAWWDGLYGWRTRKSLAPIWEERRVFGRLPPTRLLAVHARSASFPHQKGEISFNQPYARNGFCFVFNGSLEGVRMEQTIEGDIGAQKIWNLILERLRAGASLATALTEVRALLYNQASSVKGLNIGIASALEMAILCDYSTEQEYFTLHHCHVGGDFVVSSEPLAGACFSTMKRGEIISF